MTYIAYSWTSEVSWNCAWTKKNNQLYRLENWARAQQNLQNKYATQLPLISACVSAQSDQFLLFAMGPWIPKKCPVSSDQTTWMHSLILCAHNPFCRFLLCPSSVLTNKFTSFIKSWPIFVEELWLRADNHTVTVMFLSFRTDRSGQTVQTQIRLLIRVYTVCNSLCIFWMHYSKVKPPCSTYRVITANFRVSEYLGFLR